MKQDELIELLRKHEWRDIEFEEAQRKVPRDAYETVSAVSNKEGGHLAFSVRKSDQEMGIVGVLDVDLMDELDDSTRFSDPEEAATKQVSRSRLSK